MHRVSHGDSSPKASQPEDYPYTGIYGQASGVPSPPPPMVWSGTGWGGGGWRVRRGVGAVGAAAGETARRHRQGRHSTQALRKP